MWTLDRPFDQPLVCSVCGAVLRGDPDDDPRHPTGAVCGDCARARADDELRWALEAAHDAADPW